MGSASVVGCTILVVEDEPLIALELRQAFEEAGAYVFAATQLPHALALAQHPDLSVALLDYRIGDDTSVGVCERLEQRGIPFLFYTGYDDMRKEWPDTIVVNKPASSEVVVEAVRRLLGRARSERTIAPLPEAHGYLRAS